jgi:transposase
VLAVQWFVGIDWGPEAHEVCLVDREGQVVRDQWRVPHDAVSLQGLVDALSARAAGDPSQVAIAIETPRGAVVELLVERGFAVYAINPKQLDRFRDRFSPAGAKDDRRDAWVAAQSLRTDAAAFRRVQLDDPLVIQLREWSRLDETLADDLLRLTNQLRDLVYRVAPALLTLCPAADEPWVWALLRTAPTPLAQRRLSARRVERLLREHRIRRLDAAAVRAVLQQPVVYTAPGVVDAVSAHLQVLLPRLDVLATQRREAARHLEHFLDALMQQAPASADQREHSDVAIVRSMPGVGTRVAARMLAEASSLLVARAYHGLTAQMGVAPVTAQSGRRRTVAMRRACNAHLRDAAFYWAANAIQHDPTSVAYYQTLRARGHTYARALRSVVSRLLRVLCRLLERGELFDPEHRPTRASAPVAAATGGA